MASLGTWSKVSAPPGLRHPALPVPHLPACAVSAQRLGPLLLKPVWLVSALPPLCFRPLPVTAQCLFLEIGLFCHIALVLVPALTYFRGQQVFPHLTAGPRPPPAPACLGAVVLSIPSAGSRRARARPSSVTVFALHARHMLVLVRREVVLVHSRLPGILSWVVDR